VSSWQILCLSSSASGLCSLNALSNYQPKSFWGLFSAIDLQLPCECIPSCRLGHISKPWGVNLLLESNCFWYCVSIYEDE
jgi:hypothetical protein